MMSEYLVIFRPSRHNTPPLQNKMPTGPFRSATGIGRADPEWSKLNRVSNICGHGP